MSDQAFIYLVTTVESVSTPGLALGDWKPSWSIGDVVVEKESHGGEWTFEQGDSAVTTTVQLVRIGGAVELGDGDLDYSRNLARALALVQLGAQGEGVLHDRLATFGSDVEELVGDDPVKLFRLRELVKSYTRR